jgi:hypothetical protein
MLFAVIVIGILIIGALTIVASIGRIAYLGRDYRRAASVKWYGEEERTRYVDMTWNATDAGNWVFIELNLMIVCSSVFALRTLWVMYARTVAWRPWPFKSRSRQTDGDVSVCRSGRGRKLGMRFGMRVDDNFSDSERTPRTWELDDLSQRGDYSSGEGRGE